MAAPFAVPGVAFAAPARRQTPGNVTGYYVCVLDVSAAGGSTEYLSDVIPNTGFRPGQVATAFRNSLAQASTNQSAQCFERRTEAEARDFMQSTAPGVKKVFTGWKFSGAPASARQTGSPTMSAAPPAAGVAKHAFL